MVKLLFKKRKGFTLVELLVTIAVVSIIFGIGGNILFNVINDYREESFAVAKSNILSTARIYTEEHKDNIYWNMVTDEVDEDKKKQKFTCVSINELINKDFLDKDVNKGNKLSNYVLVWKDEFGTIIKEEFDKVGFGSLCGSSDTSVAIPTRDYCQNVIYDGGQHILTKELGDGVRDKITFSNNSGKISAGSYEVTAKLNEGYHWVDGTREDKKFNCSIKKKIPELTISSSGSTNLVGQTVTVTVKSTDVSGKLSVKSSNNAYFEASINGNSNIAINETKEVYIKFLSEREVNGYVTITLTPDDKTNYYNNSKIFEIGNPTKKEVIVPTSATYCKNPSYNGSNQNLINDNKYSSAFNDGIILSNVEHTNIGDYIITAALRYGSVWKDKTGDDAFKEVTFTCSIERPVFTITYDGNGGVTSDNTTSWSEEVVYEDSYYTKANNFSLIGHTFNGWNEKADGTGTSWTDWINKAWTWTYLRDVTLFAQWRANNYTVKYDCNGGSGSMADSTATYKSNFITRQNACTKPGYTFNGWKEQDGTIWSLTSSGVYESGKSWKWTYTKDIKLTAQWKANNYTVSYNCNGGSGSMANSTATYDSNFITRQSTCSRSGYLFNGWKDQDGTVWDLTDAGVYESGKSWKWTYTKDIKLTAQWKVNSYTVTYNCNGGSGSMANSTATYNSNFITRQNTCSKAGNTFNGWKDQNGTDWSLTSEGVYESGKSWKWTYTNNINLTAQWKEHYGKIYYYPNGGSAVDKYPLASNGASSEVNTFYYSSTNYNPYNVTTLFKRTGYHVPSDAQAWRLGSATSNTFVNQASYNFSSSATASGSAIKLYANWEVNTFTIKYNANGGTGTMADTVVTYGVSTKTSDNKFLRSGYQHMGWHAYRKVDNKWYWTKSDGTYAWYVEGQQPSGAIKYIYKNAGSVSKTSYAHNDIVTFYAVWEKDKMAPECYVSNITCRTWTPTGLDAAGKVTITCNEAVKNVDLYYGYAGESSGKSNFPYTSNDNKKKVNFYFRKEKLVVFNYVVTDLNGNVAGSKSFSSIDKKYIKEGSNVVVGSDYIEFPLTCPLPDA